MKALPAGGRFTGAFAALLALGIGLAYSGSLDVGFYFDAMAGITNNPAIRSLRNIPSFFTDPYAFWSEHTLVDVRPVLLITYAVNYAISGLEPWSYHVLDLTPADRGPSGEARVPAAAAALFFALAPLNSQPVAFVWARSALLCVTLYLGAFLAFVRRRWALGAVLFALALLTKAIAVTLPAMLLIHDFIYRDRRRYPTVQLYVADGRRLTLPVLLPAVLDAAYLTYRALVLPAWAAKALHEAWVTPWIWFMSQWSALLYYVRLFAWPDALSMDDDFPYTTSLLAPRAWVALLVLLAWIGLALRAVRRYPQVTFATVWFFVTLAPESSFVPLSEVVNDHRPYIASSLGLSVLLAWLLHRGAALVAARPRATFAAVSLGLCVAAVPFDRYRTWQWQDALRMWEDTVRKSPNNGRAWMNAGQTLMSRGDFVAARRYLGRARELMPRSGVVYMSVSLLEAREGHLEEALRAANEAVRLRPDYAPAHFLLGNVLARAGRTEEAAAAYRRAAALDPRDTAAPQALARLTGGGDQDEEQMSVGLDALRKLHDPERAAAIFRKVLEHTPTHYGATYQLAAALDAAGRPSEARPLWEKMLRMAEGSPSSTTCDSCAADSQARRDVERVVGLRCASAGASRVG